ncbi:hypoxia-inducible factor 1-alpha-like isoform X2 [Mizuhopecten yessoensis]|uniref:Hypoxia-inducible factor 1-alpha n=1 Tax=Mizuhopecten yessoensis TaxID=6573 RepID=A0A210QNQ5_MIZYE|nr:hypoxia-inducible factor 1-alpha-like isoform X2 [Mizuhopecten yessoensis]OWF50362.1 Hypoxia-inducible factor 1-alpha [Mizuhopecten yessoensis]
MPYKNSEKRKEKSRDAARCRRGKETEVFSELAKELPLPPFLNQLDKASVMRVAISHLKIRQIMDKMDVQDLESKESLEDVDNLYGKALDGFVVIISDNCDIAYVSESVAKYLGIPQIDMIGQSLYDFTHPCDHDEIADMMSAKSHKGMEQQAEEHSMFVRMKCTLTSKGRSVNLKSASYKVIKFTGKLIEIREERMVRKEEEEEEVDDLDEDMDQEEEEKMEKEPRRTGYFLGVGEPIPHPSNIEVLLDCKTVLSRHNMDSKFTYCDSRMKELVGYSSEELIGKSIFSYHHAQDSSIIDKAYKDLFAKGQMMTGQYRFLVKQGGFVWVITQATVIYNSRTQKPQCIVCVHYLTSGVEQDNVVLSDVQKAEVKTERKKDVKEVIQWSFGPSTKDVFVSKTPEDEKADFYFCEDVPKSCSKQMDLQHLAPIAGDACVPLDTTFFNGPAKQEQGNNDPHVIVLKEEPRMPLCSGHDPKMISPTSTACSTPLSASPMHSPAPPITDDFLITINPADIVAMDQFFTTMDMTQMQMSDSCLAGEEIDMDTRAPYIPMDSSDDFSLLPPAPDELFNLGGDFNPGLFGRTESVFTSKDKLFPEEPPQKRRPSLWDMLEGSTTVATLKRPVDNGIMQMKRPLDKTNQEKGPPIAKKSRPDIGHKSLSRGPLGSDSVLMNLLLTGEDHSYGYKVFNARNEKTANTSSNIKQLPPNASKWGLTKSVFLPKITQHDCEVNAPSFPCDGLLQGDAIIQALERDAYPQQII